MIAASRIYPFSMPATSTSTRAGAPSAIARFLTGRRSAWVVLLIFLLAAGGATAALRTVDTAPRGTNLPATAESKLVADTLKTFPGSERQPVLVVASRSDQGALGRDATGAFSGLAAELSGDKPVIIPSEDGKAVLALVPLPATDSSSDNLEQVLDVREKIARAAKDNPALEGLNLQVTGGPAFGGDIANSFSGANVTLLVVTISIVAVLLLITYRSPLLWLLPLLVVGTADQTATNLSNWLSLKTGWHAEGGIVSVLVFGAGANYALLMISRYREELHHTEDHRLAMQRAWVGTRGAIIASNLTVVLGLMTLLFAALPDTRGLGLSSGAGLLLALLSVLLVLPAILSIVGRGIFWPFVPRPGQASQKPGLWGRLAESVAAHPIRALVAGLAVLGVFATGLIGTRVGLDQAEQFRVEAESIDGLQTVAAHYPAGFTAPINVIAKQAQAADVTSVLKETPGVTSVQPTGSHDGWVRLQLIGKDAPGTDEALDTVRTLRDRVHAVDGAEAKVGGSIAEDLDKREAQRHDVLLTIPLVLSVSLLVLIALTRSLVAPFLLLAINVTSAAAAIGAGSVVSRWVMDSPALASEVPLFAFIFLVALGIDYTIFLVERARHEAVEHGTRRGMVEAVRHTGAVITSAGIVLAAVFAALGVLPLVVMGQLGIIVCLGVLVDTLLVRTVIVPAVFELVGDRIWWPGRPQAAGAPEGGRS